MSAPTRYDWSRVRQLVKAKLPGRHEWQIVYHATLDASTILNVYRHGAYWKWLVIGVASRPLVLRHGEAPTMHEAKLRAEAALTIGEGSGRQLDLPITETEARQRAIRKASDVPF